MAGSLVCCTSPTYLPLHSSRVDSDHMSSETVPGPSRDSVLRASVRHEDGQLGEASRDQQGEFFGMSSERICWQRLCG